MTSEEVEPEQVLEKEEEESNNEGKDDEEDYVRGDKMMQWGAMIGGIIMIISGVIVLVKSSTSGNNEDEDELESSSSSPATDEEEDDRQTKTIVGLICSAGGIVMMVWGWCVFGNSSDVTAKSKKSKTVTSEEDGGNEEGIDQQDGAREGEGAEQEQESSVPPLPPRPVCRNRLNDEIPEGELPYDKLIVGGTLSLGIMLLIGGIVILIISVIDKSSFDDANTEDFVSLGSNACRIQRTVFYDAVTERVDALNSLCHEEYQYQVELILGGDGDMQRDDGNQTGINTTATTATFVSTVMSKTRCKRPCDVCNQLYGENHYTGVDITRPGTSITDDLFVECWGPTKPVDQLSDFYTCGTSTAENGDGNIGEVDPIDATSCYQLQDPTIEIKNVQGSQQVGMIAAIIALIGAVMMLCWGGYFIWRNRKAWEEYEQKQNGLSMEAAEEQEEAVEAIALNDDTLDVAAPTSTSEESQELNDEEDEEEYC